MSDCVKILPGQWPPLNCPSGLLRRYEAHLTPGDKVTPVAEQSEVPPHPMDISSATLLDPQLRAEKVRFEKFILHLPNGGYRFLREQLEQSLSATNSRYARASQLVKP